MGQVDQSTEILDYEFQETELKYLIMLMKKEKRIKWYKNYHDELKKKLKDGFGLTDIDIARYDIFDSLKAEIEEEERELNEWTAELVADQRKQDEIRKVS